MLSAPEIVFIVIVALVLLGPQKLPEMARSLGSALGEFKKAQRESELQVNQQASVDPKIRGLAEDLGINVEDKTEQQILEEIKQRTSTRASDDQGTFNISENEQ